MLRVVATAILLTSALGVSLDNRTQLHVHLDGAVGAQTLFTIATERNLSLPLVGHPSSVESIRILLLANPGFKTFDVVNNIMGGDEAALAQAASAFMDTQAAQNITYVEVRYDPVRAATSAYANVTIPLEAAVRAVQAGLQAGMQRHPRLVAHQLLCAMRGKPSSACLAIAELAAALHSEVTGPGGVVGIDLAGDEWNAANNNTQYVSCFRHAKQLGLNTTLHSGETLPWPLRWPNTTLTDVYSAVNDMHVDRIGHGYAAAKDPAVLAAIRRAGVHLEACPQTANGEGSLDALAAFRQANISFGISTDDPCMGCTEPRSIVADEELAQRRLGFSTADIQRAHDEARRHAFGAKQISPEWARRWRGVAGSSTGRAGAASEGTAYDTRWFEQKVDHFNKQDARSWKQRFLINMSNWDGRGRLANGCRGPLLYYTGNEGPITAFWASNGFMVDRLAPRLGAMLVFGEARYYGASMPFGNASFGVAALRFLSTEQIVADHASLITHLKASVPGAAGCPVVAFGGSYGATLTTYLRASFPDVVVGGLAASAPIGYYDSAHWPAHAVSTYTWSDIVSRVYNETTTPFGRCTEAIHAANSLIESNRVADNVAAFGVCSPEALGPNPSALFSYALESLPQMNYPYAIGDLPGWPVNATCDMLVAALDADAPSTLLKAAAAVTNLVLGPPPDGSCRPALPEGPGGVPGDGPGPDAWGWQSCTENLHEFSTRQSGVRARAFQFDYNLSAVQPCDLFFNGSAVPDPMALTRLYGGYSLSSATGLPLVTNIIWSNGALDPWSGGGLYAPQGPQPFATSGGNRYYFFMPQGAHHLDLRAPNPSDPPHVTAVRAKEEQIIQKWIEDAAAA